MANGNTSAAPAEVAANSGELHHLFVFPGCTEEVQILALALALDAAYVGHRDGLDLLPLAPLIAQKYLRVEVNGKRGTNDLHAYHTLLAEVFRRAYPAWQTLLDASPLSSHLASFVLDSPEYKRALHHMAMANLLALFATPATEPLALQWPF